MRAWQVYLLALILWIPSAGLRPPSRQQELRVLVTARNMIESGHFLRPEFQNQPRFRKPPMAYWVAAAGMGLSGRHQAAWAGRIFFLLFACGALWCLMHLSQTEGISIALIALFTLGFQRFGPQAETDFLQLAGILLVVVAWQRQAGIVAGIGISFACLSKGPGGFIIPAALFLLLARIYRPKLSFLSGALLLPALLIGSWAAYLYFDPVAFSALQQDITDTFVDSAHTNPWYYYVYTLPLVMLPAFLLVMFSFKQVSGKISTLESRTAWTWLAVTFILLSLTLSKQRHYALLLIPPAAWVMALHLQPVLTRRHFHLLLLLACSISAGEWVFIRTSDDYRNMRFLQNARPHIVDTGLLHVVGINSAIFDFHLGRHVHNIDDPQRAVQRAGRDDAVVVVMKRSQWRDSLPETPPARSDDDDHWIRRLYLPSPES
ncbi:MAG: glycosyltransferase family 39 protein [Kiritimatiellia bacterium]